MRFFLLLCSLFVLLFVYACSSSDSSLTNPTTALTNSPEANPASLDSALSRSRSNKQVRAVSQAKHRAPNSTLDLEIVSTPLSNGIKYVSKQCDDDEQEQYTSLTATNVEGSSSILYVLDETIAGGDFEGNKNITASIQTDANGLPNGSRSSTVRSTKPFDFYASFSSDGTINTFAATNGTNHVVGAWNSTLGCAKVGEGGTNVAFSLSVSSTGEKTCSASTDETLCTSLPTMVTSVPAFQTFSGDQVYTCEKASGCSQASPTSAMGLEDAGGTYCADLSGSKGHWKDAETTVDCSTTTTATGVCACLNPFFAAATQQIKSAKRSGLCKVTGSINNGDFDLGTDISTGKTVCIEDLPISASRS